MVALFLLAAVPVYRLTRPAQAVVISPATDHSPDTASAKPVPLDVDIVFAPAPVDFQLKNLDQTILAGSGPQSRFAAQWKTTLPPEGVDLVIQARWPMPATGDAAAPSPAAARIKVQFPDGRTVEKSFWTTDGSVTEAFTIPGTNPAVATP